MLHGKFCALAGEIKDVNRDLAFGVNQGDFDVACQVRQPRADAVEKPGPIVCDDLQYRAARRASVVEIDSRYDFSPGSRGFFAARAIAQHFVQIGFAVQDVANAALESLPLRQVQLESAKTVSEVKRVHHRTRGIGKSASV